MKPNDKSPDRPKVPEVVKFIAYVMANCNVGIDCGALHAQLADGNLDDCFWTDEIDNFAEFSQEHMNGCRDIAYLMRQMTMTQRYKVYSHYFEYRG